MTTKCRARTVRGDWVTFDHIDRGPDDRALVWSEFVGEGFHARAGCWASYDLSARREYDRLALERAGIDTSTAERLDCLVEYRFDHRMPSDLREQWEPLFPPTVSNDPITSWSQAQMAKGPPGLTGYTDEFRRIGDLPTPEMVVAGQKEYYRIIGGPFLSTPSFDDWFIRIWREMERVRKA